MTRNRRLRRLHELRHAANRERRLSGQLRTERRTAVELEIDRLEMAQDRPNRERHERTMARLDALIRRLGAS